MRPKLERAEIKIRGIVSDKETYLVNAIRKVFPEVKHQLCQLHFIRNLADPAQKRDKILASVLKNSIR
ncbi:MAG: transposase [Candidatus Njordarchaeota archaeon]